MFADDPILPVPTPPAPPASSDQVATDPAVDEVVQAGSDLQDLFAKNDQVAATTAQPVPVATSDDDVVPSTPADDTQRNPLDILEEILNEREKEKAEEEKPVSTEPTPEELEKQRLVAEEEAKKTEQVRQQMQAELTTPENQNRAEIRTQQANDLKTDNPFEIKQLQHQKTG